jgi:hypothetical protein
MSKCNMSVNMHLTECSLLAGYHTRHLYYGFIGFAQSFQQLLLAPLFMTHKDHEIRVGPPLALGSLPNISCSRVERPSFRTFRPGSFPRKPPLSSCVRVEGQEAQVCVIAHPAPHVRPALNVYRNVDVFRKVHEQTVWHPDLTVLICGQTGTRGPPHLIEATHSGQFHTASPRLSISSCPRTVTPQVSRLSQQL